MIADDEARFLKKIIIIIIKKKKWRPAFGPKSDLKLGFLPFSQVWFIKFP